MAGAATGASADMTGEQMKGCYPRIPKKEQLFCIALQPGRPPRVLLYPRLIHHCIPLAGTLRRGAAAQAAPAATLPTEATMATTTTVASTTTTSLAAALPTTGGRRGPRGEGSPAMATEDSPATTGARATTPATTMAMGITPAMAMATTQVMAMATVTTTTTTGAVVSETASVLPISSAATSAQATSAPGQTTMVDQLIWPFLLFDIDLEI